LTSFGVDRVIDHTTADFTAETTRYDVIVDRVGMAVRAGSGTSSSPARCCS
jgi:hypothetical protein